MFDSTRTTPANARPFRLIVLIGLLLSLVGLGAPVVASGSPDLRQVDLKQALRNTVNGGVPGSYAHAVTPDGTWQGSVGVGDLRTGAQPRPGGRFRAGSVTKSFVATVVLQLVAERRIGLADPIAEHLPGLLPYPERITVRQVLGHTSGLPRDIRHPNTLPEVDTERWESYTPEELVRGATDNTPLISKPGTRFNYSNIGYTTLGLLVERVTGRSLRAEVTDRIVRPLGLRDTALPTDFPFLPQPAARGYEQLYPKPAERTDITTTRMSRFWGSGNLISSTADLNTFFRALLGGRLLPEPQLDAMKTSRPKAIGQTGYGLGLMSWPDRCDGPTWYGHAGDIFGYHTMSMHTADLRRSVTAGMNQDVTAGRGAHQAMQFDALPAALCEPGA